MYCQDEVARERIRSMLVVAQEARRANLLIALRRARRRADQAAKALRRAQAGIL